MRISIPPVRLTIEFSLRQIEEESEFSVVVKAIG